jgi:hypothetical protein
MTEVRSIDGPSTAASFALGRKLDSIPFSAYHVSIITVLASSALSRAMIW